MPHIWVNLCAIDQVQKRVLDRIVDVEKHESAFWQLETMVMMSNYSDENKLTPLSAQEGVYLQNVLQIHICFNTCAKYANPF